MLGSSGGIGKGSSSDQKEQVRKYTGTVSQSIRKQPYVVDFKDVNAQLFCGYKRIAKPTEDMMQPSSTTSPLSKCSVRPIPIPKPNNDPLGGSSEIEQERFYNDKTWAMYDLISECRDNKYPERTKFCPVTTPIMKNKPASVEPGEMNVSSLPDHPDHPDHPEDNEELIFQMDL